MSGEKPHLLFGDFKRAITGLSSRSLCCLCFVFDGGSLAICWERTSLIGSRACPLLREGDGTLTGTSKTLILVIPRLEA